MTNHPDPEPPTTGIFADHALTYWRQGWTPIPVQGKTRILKHTTGRDGPQPTMADIAHWTHQHPNWNIAIRCAPDQVGIDVDAYDTKQGARTLTAAQQALGPLPATWTTTSRDGTTSGIRWYRKPSPVEYRGIIQYQHPPNEFEPDGAVTADIEIIQFHHRYAVAPPSIHPGTHKPYRWIDPQGNVSLTPPRPEDLPELPQTWHDYLTAPPDLAETHPAVEWGDQHADRNDWHPTVTTAVQNLAETVTGPAGSRHDHALAITLKLLRYERIGRAGATSALATVIDMWTEHMADQRDSPEHARREIIEMIATGTTKVATTETLHLEHDQIRELLGAGQPATTSDPDPQPPPGLTTLNETQLEQLPPPQPLVPGWFYRNTLATIYGPPKSGKTFIALDIAMAAARGVDWAGGFTRPTNVIYVAAEGVAGMAARAHAWRQHHHEGHGNIRWIPQAIQLHDPNQRQQLIDLAGDDTGLIILDTLARCTVGAEENSAKDTGLTIAGLDHIRTQTGACVLALHHTGKDTERGMRGSNALDGALDTAIGALGDTTALKLVTRYQKDAEPAEPIWIRFERTGNSLVPVPGQPDTDQQNGDHQMHKINLMQAVKRRRGNAPLTRQEWFERAGGARNGLIKAFAEMLDDGYFEHVSGDLGGRGDNAAKYVPGRAFDGAI